MSKPGLLVIAIAIAGGVSVIYYDSIQRVAIGAILSAVGGNVSRRAGDVREEFHRVLTLAGDGQISLKNITGAVRIMAWDRDEVDVKAVKLASSRQRLGEVDIQVTGGPGAVRIETVYSSGTPMWIQSQGRDFDNPATVEYTITVPRSARLADIEVVNSPLEIEGVSGEIVARCTNGRLTARGLASGVRLSTLNGQVDAAFESVNPSGPVVMESVNGNILLTIPSDARAEIKAEAGYGGISNNLGLPVRPRGLHEGVSKGGDLAGLLGEGGARIELMTLNGNIQILHASDGRGASTVTDLLPRTPQTEIERLESQARRLETGPMAAKGLASSESTASSGAHYSNHERGEEREQRSLPSVAVETGTFSVSGLPSVVIETFDGSITVHTWEKTEVMFSSEKRGGDEEFLRGIKVKGEQSGGEVRISAEFDLSHGRRRASSVSVRAAANLDVYVPRNSRVRATTADGGIKIEGAMDNVDVRTGHGGISLEGEFAALNAFTGEGPILAAFPGAFDATVRTHAQSVINDGLATPSDSSADRVRNWKVGRGGPVLTLHTGNGVITLRRSAR
ncbi:MAG TPA: hypothetical protein VNH22_04730 [Blastocatellia bacterium]|jgi:DUF4097 and DUF4098 domain-containing protein YvlB|nr:hypothetical protein [Blastocatellia bacterium]